MIYENTAPSVGELFKANGLTDVYFSAVEVDVLSVENEGIVGQAIDDGLPTSVAEMIAIGGSDFDYEPFMLKGPVPNDTTDADTRLYHLTPEATSRVAILSTYTAVFSQSGSFCRSSLQRNRPDRGEHECLESIVDGGEDGTCRLVRLGKWYDCARCHQGGCC